MLIKATDQQLKFEIGGIWRVINGQIYVDDVPLMRVFEKGMGQLMVDRYAELNLAIPFKNIVYPVDQHIKPLVDAMACAGFTTLSSCEGHMEKTASNGKRYPFVAFIAEGADLDLLQDNVPDGWHISFEDYGVAVIKPQKESGDAIELEWRQAQVKDLVDAILAATPQREDNVVPIGDIVLRKGLMA